MSFRVLLEFKLSYQILFHMKLKLLCPCHISSQTFLIAVIHKEYYFESDYS